MIHDPSPSLKAQGAKSVLARRKMQDWKCHASQNEIPVPSIRQALFQPGVFRMLDSLEGK
jgi:hypothetical protein